MNQLQIEKLTNIEIVQEFFQAQYEGDFDRAFDNYAHPNFQWIVGSQDNEALRNLIPWAGYTHHGKEGYIRLTSLLFSEFEVINFTPERYTQGGDRVFVEGHFSFRHNQTKKVVNSDWLARFDIQDDHILGGQFYENTAGVAQARITA